MTEHILSLYLPLIITNVLHMIVVKKHFLKNLQIPINASVFGKNKTYRGVVFVTLTNAIILWILDMANLVDSPINAFLFGGIIGLSYILFELPNSFMKRKMGIAPGENAKKYKILFMVIDRCDSAIGVCLCYVLFKGLGFREFSQLFILAFIVHFSFSFLLFKLKIKDRL